MTVERDLDGGKVPLKFLQRKLEGCDIRSEYLRKHTAGAATGLKWVKRPEISYIRPIAIIIQHHSHIEIQHFCRELSFPEISKANEE